MKSINYDTDIICINLKSLGQREIFMICEKYTIDFESIYAYKVEGNHKIWIHLPTTCTIATQINDSINFSIFFKEYKLIGPTKKEFNKLKSMNPVVIPKLIKTQRSIDSYIYFIDKGYDIKMESMERYIEHIKSSNIEEIDPIRLNELIDIALDKKDFIEVDRLCKYLKKTR